VNQTDAPVHIDGRFRVDGTDVQVWRPMDGAMTDDKPGETAGYTTVAGILDRSGNRQPGIEPAAYITGSGFTVVSLDLAERESVFVVFRDVAAGPARSASTPVWTRLTALTGPWTLSFPPNLGAPASVQMTTLKSWTGSSNGRQVLLRHSDVQQDCAGAGVVVQAGAASLDQSGQGA